MQFELFRIAIWQCIISPQNAIKKKKRRKMYLFLSSYQQSVQMNIYSKKSVFILPCEFVCLLTIIMDISYLNVYYPVLLWQWMILLLCRVACFLLHKCQKVLYVYAHMKYSVSYVLKAYSYCEYTYRMLCLLTSLIAWLLYFMTLYLHSWGGQQFRNDISITWFL